MSALGFKPEAITAPAITDEISYMRRVAGIREEATADMAGVRAALEGVYLAEATVTTAQVLALNNTAIAVVAAPGEGLAIVPRKVVIHKPAGTAYGGIAAGEDMVLRYTNASGVICSATIECTGFLDSTSALTAAAGMPTGSYLVTANAAVMLHMLTGEITTGDSDLHVMVWYDVVSAVF